MKTGSRQAALLIAWVGLCSAVHGAISSVRIRPASPTAQDTVTFTMEGSFPDICWSVSNFVFVQLSPIRFAASVDGYDIWRPGLVCLQVVSDYSYSESLGLLAPGTYTVFVTENHQSIRDPWPDQATLQFEVRDYLPPVQDLRIARSGSSIVLGWTAVAGATGYRIYRSPECEFEVGSACLLDSTSASSYTDNNVLVLPGSRFFYRVTAVW